MAKKDFLINENKDNSRNDDKDLSAYNKIDGNKNADKNEHTEVKNAHASGLGSMGRNDEKLNDGGEKPQEKNY